MSIYSGHRQLPSDVQVEHVARKLSAAPAAQPVHLRKAQPASTLLPRTVAWVASLPPPMRPHCLTSQFARVANQLGAVWTDAAACREYLASLLIDTRGGRKGFPEAVLSEIEALQAFHARINPAQMRETDWRGTSRSLWDGSKDT
jgi:hypothetical protein